VPPAYRLMALFLVFLEHVGTSAVFAAGIDGLKTARHRVGRPDRDNAKEPFGAGDEDGRTFPGTAGGFTPRWLKPGSSRSTVSSSAAMTTMRRSALKSHDLPTFPPVATTATIPTCQALERRFAPASGQPDPNSAEFTIERWFTG
jgi:hypothetical protein